MAAQRIAPQHLLHLQRQRREGRVCVSIDGRGCLDCLGLLDRKAVRQYLESDEQREREDEIYGIAKGALERKGPSVSPVNGVIAALAATEFMVAVTGLRAPTRLQEYRGWQSKVVVVADEPQPDCPICAGLWGKPAEADVERYLRLPHLLRPRGHERKVGSILLPTTQALSISHL
jgi:hypothetical protein